MNKKAEKRAAALDEALADRPRILDGQIALSIPDNLPAAVDAAEQAGEYTPPSEVKEVEITIHSTSYNVVTDAELEDIFNRLEASWKKYCKEPPETRSLKGTSIVFGRGGVEFEAFVKSYRFNNHSVQINSPVGWSKRISRSILSLAGFRKEIDSLLQHMFITVPKFQEQMLQEYEGQINAALNLASKSYIAVGLVLREIKRKNLLNDPLYLGDSAKVNFWAYAEDKFGFKKSSVKNMIAICEKYCVYDNGAYLPEIKKDYCDFNYTQLVDLYRLEEVYGVDVKTAKIKPSMTTRELRAAVDEHSPKKKSQSIDSADGDGDAQLTAPAIGLLPQHTPPPVEEQSVDAEEFVPAKNTMSFKNIAERKDFLDNYKAWALWMDIPALQIKIYRVPLSDGSTILTLESAAKNWKNEDYTESHHILCKAGEPVRFNATFTAPTYILDHMTKNKVFAYLPTGGSVSYPA